MENKGLLFIPDISGFSRFVAQTEIDHSRLIIQELLEILINANSMGLEISEIEGDAILFYKFGDPPAVNDLYKQVEKMFVEFHRSITVYDQRRYCQCEACISAVNLTLKVITHYGEFTGYNVKNFSKLIGKDVIVAHQLLKNDIDQHEYWLITENLLTEKKSLNFAGWMNWKTSRKQTESGEVSFQYTQLGQLRKEIPPPPSRDSQLQKMSKMFSVRREYDTDIITLFHASGDFRYRDRWQVGVKSVETFTHFLPRVGMRCRCVTEDGVRTISSSYYNFQEDKIQFTETDEERGTCTHYTLEKVAVKRTKLTLDFYIKKNPLSEIIFRLSSKSKLENALRKSSENLDGLAKDLKIPTAINC